MSLIAAIKGTGPSGFGYGSTAEEVTFGLNLKGRTVLVTGCSSGLGLETARVLAARGAHVLATARTEDKAKDAITYLDGELTPVACELSDPRSVRACVSRVQGMDTPLSAIICNAGIMALPKRQLAFGLELQFFTNHIGHFMLVTGLLDTLADDGRVVVVSSEAHRSAPRAGIRFDDLAAEKSYAPWTAYGQSKLANVLFTRELARRLEPGQTANTLHPGVIQTNLSRSMSTAVRGALTLAKPIFLKTAAQGAATQCYLAVHPQLSGVTGEYFADCNIARPSRAALDPAMATRLWAESERIVAALPD